MASEFIYMNWKCHDCNMSFSSPGLLQKHKAKFCVGGTYGDPNTLLLRRGLLHPDDYEPRPPTPEDDYRRHNPNSDAKLAQLAESHGRQMEMLQGRNRDLERQREEIRRRLEELGKRPLKGDDQTAALLQELRDQEARNQRLLDELKRQLMAAKQPINIIEQQQQKQERKFIYPMFYGGSLVAEISAIRQAYVANGGTDPEVLSQLAQMLAEAQALEEQLRNANQKRPKEKHHPDYSQNILQLEMENERLQRELLFLQEQNLLAKNRRKDEREGPPQTTHNIHVHNYGDQTARYGVSSTCRLCQDYFNHIAVL